MIKTTPYILFVDDDENDRERIRQCCEELFIAGRVRLLASGEALFDFLRSREGTGNFPSLIVLDVHMPGMCGEETLVHLKRNIQYRHIPVVMLSAAIPSPERFTGLGAEAFYRKPDNDYPLKQVLASLYEQVSP